MAAFVAMIGIVLWVGRAGLKGPVSRMLAAVSVMLLLGLGQSMSGEEKAVPERPEKPGGEHVPQEEPLFISEVLGKADELVGKKIAVVACLLTHFEGPWICLHPDAPLEGAIGLELAEGCVLMAKDGERRLDWLENDQGYPAVITGALRMRGKRGPGDTEVRLYMDVAAGRELPVDDPLWRGYARQFVNEGEVGDETRPAGGKGTERKNGSESPPESGENPR